jgi:CTP:molybdopterin cytidylyltransferase MocA
MAADDHIRTLTRLGLTSYEARAYLALVRVDRMAAAQIARAAGLPRQRIYDVLAGLTARDLVATLPGRVVGYAAAAPETGIGRLLAARRDALEQLTREADTLAAALGPAFEAARAGRATDCAAVILAAGTATRFGSAKLLAALDGVPLLQHVLDLAAGAQLDPVVVVLGRDAPALRQACTWRDEIVVVNPDPVAGLSGSVRLGLAQLELSEAARTVMLMGDQPRLSATQLGTVLGAPVDQARPIVVPRYEGRPGNPALLERAAWALAATIAGDAGMAQLFGLRPELVRYVEVKGANPDVDTPAELRALEAAR